MKAFAALVNQLDETTKTNARVATLSEYFNQASDQDKLWTIALLSGRRPKRVIKTSDMRLWASEVAEIPLWLFEDSYHVVGDLAETIALLLPEPEKSIDLSLSAQIEDLLDIKDKTEELKKKWLLGKWNSLPTYQRFVFHKIITGGFRIGISQKLMVRALSASTDIDENTLAFRLMGNWTPQQTTFQKLIVNPDAGENKAQPYPFYLAYPLEDDLQELGNIADWQAEYKWDGIRGQIVKRGEVLAVWSRGEELVTDKYPEYHALQEYKQDFVIDGEILAWKDDQPLPFKDIQTRIGRKNISKNLLEKVPVIFMAYDLLELNGQDLRNRPLLERRIALDNLIHSVNNENMHLSPIVEFRSWESLTTIRANSRANLVEGLMLKHKNSPYEVGRKKGSWWKWKIDPLTIDAVLIYAMRGHGRRANLYTDYTFAVWDDDLLVPFAKAYSGLTDVEFKAVDAFVKKNIKEKFGPVRSVKPELVFELAFEGIAESKRHKSGIALRFPRMKRWRKDKKAEDANTLEDLKQLLPKNLV